MTQGRARGQNLGHFYILLTYADILPSIYKENSYWVPCMIGFHSTASDAYLHARALNLGHLVFWGVEYENRLGVYMPHRALFLVF